MSLRWKFSLMLAAIAAASALAASIVGYAATRAQLFDRIDIAITQRADRLADIRHHLPPGGIPPDRAPFLNPRPPGSPDHDDAREASLGQAVILTQFIAGDGKVTAVDGTILPVDSKDLEIASNGGESSPRLRDAELANGASVRVATASVVGGGAIQAAQGLDETNEVLSDLRTRLLILTLLVIAAAVAAGLLLARRATASLEELTAAAETVSKTGNPEAEITVSGSDEIGRLGRSLTQMLATLARSREQQQRLVQDAGHELRTPLTSLRTNIAVVENLERLSPEDQARLLADLRSETAELSALVDELVQLSSGDAEAESAIDVSRIAERAAERAARRSGREIIRDFEPAPIEGRARSLDRAISNLLDNAIKFDQSAAPIRLTVRPNRVEVSDSGPGIPKDQRELVFERFHRSIEARNLPGSGLGLSIVSQIAAEHGGTAYAEESPSGGATVGFTFIG